MTLADLSGIVPAVSGDHSVAWQDHRAVIVNAIANQPRSLQAALGPSEVGTDCDRCLAHMLAGDGRKEGAPAWLPFIGTAVHEALALAFADANAELPNVRYLVETTVTVGKLRGFDVTGHCDLVDLHLRLVNDWKIVGKSTLDKVRAAGPGNTYRRQVHLYAAGLRARGVPVETVQISFLPRNAISIDAGHIWSEPYSDQIASDAMQRANAIANGVDALGLEGVLTQVGPHTGAEFSCTRFTDPSTAPAGEVTPDAFLGV